MARHVLYGSSGTTQPSSTEYSSSNAFTLNSQTKKFPNKTTPLKTTSLDQNSKNATVPKSVYIDYLLNGTTISSVQSKLDAVLNKTEVGAQKTFTKYTNYYNRFKIPTLNDAFQKGFAHVFFTRPDCNVMKPGGKALNDSFEADTEFHYVWKNNPSVVKQLSLDNGQDHQFMLALANKAASFSLKDEQLVADTYGKSFKGWQIAYGRNNIESKSSDNFTVRYNDDRTLHIYWLHKLWVEYISDVYLGKKAPKAKYIRERMLDYVSSCYYIITAEDGETIIFWSKYYGVFPTTVPANQFAWAQGNVIKADEFDIEYHYSFKEDMNPDALIEFNMNAGIDGNKQYMPIYDPKVGHIGTTWVGAPYIELVTDNTDPECPYTFKLRFSKKTNQVN
jgi:hypothetical protein